MSKKIRCIFYILMVVFLEFSTVFAYGGETHIILTREACAHTGMLEKLFNSEWEQINMHKKLLGACVSPDEKEVGFAFHDHFWDSHIEMDKIKYGYEKDNAMFRMLEHYRNGIELWKKVDNKEGAIEELGKTLHYMQDICCNAHKQSWIKNLFKLPSHLMYENYMDKHAVEYSINIMSSSTKYDFRLERLESEWGDDDILKIAQFFTNNNQTNDNKSEKFFAEFENSYKASCVAIYYFFRNCDKLL